MSARDEAGGGGDDALVRGVEAGEGREGAGGMQGELGNGGDSEGGRSSDQNW